jgi:hypothetical protein
MTVDGMRRLRPRPSTAPPFKQPLAPSNKPSTMPSFLRTSKTPSFAPTGGPSNKPLDNPTAALTQIPTKAPSSSSFLLAHPSSLWDANSRLSLVRHPSRRRHLFSGPFRVLHHGSAVPSTDPSVDPGGSFESLRCTPSADPSADPRLDQPAPRLR